MCLVQGAAAAGRRGAPGLRLAQSRLAGAGPAHVCQCPGHSLSLSATVTQEGGQVCNHWTWQYHQELSSWQGSRRLPWSAVASDSARLRALSPTGAVGPSRSRCHGLKLRLPADSGSAGDPRLVQYFKCYCRPLICLVLESAKTKSFLESKFH